MNHLTNHSNNSNLNNEYSGLNNLIKTNHLEPNVEEINN